MTETKRGRKSQSNYRELVAKALRSDRFALEEFPVFSQLPAVEQWAATHDRELLPHGKALQIFLRQAVTEVIERIGEVEGATVKRLVDYLQLRYLQGLLVKEIALQWHLSIEQVWRSVGRRALELVTEQFLQIARCPEQKSQVLHVVPRPEQLPRIG